MLKLRVVFIFLLGLFALLQNPVVASINASPLGLDLIVAPGEREVGSFLVKNTGDDAQEITVALNDYMRTPTGENQFLPAGTLPQSLEPFVSFSPATFGLEAGETQEVQFEIAIPDNVTGAHWVMFLVRENAPVATNELGIEGQSGGFGFNASVSFGIRVRQLDPTTVLADGRISQVAVLLPDEADGLINIEFMFENTGTTFLQPEGVVEIRDTAGQTVASVPVEVFRILPGARRILSVELQDTLPPGKYVALAVIDFDGDFLVAGQSVFTVEN